MKIVFSRCIMKCCVPYCKSYNKNSKVADTCNKVKFYQIPSNAEIREKWLKNIARRDWTPSDRSTVCNLHFQPDDFRTGLKISKLKATAVPTIFPNYPKYMQEAAKKSRYRRNQPKLRLPPPEPQKRKISEINKPKGNQSPLRTISSNSVNDESEIVRNLQCVNLSNSNDENVENTNEINSRNSDSVLLHSAIHDHSLLFKQARTSHETEKETQNEHSEVDEITFIDPDNLPKRGRPALPYSEMKKQLYFYKKKVWRLNKKIQVLAQRNKNLKEQLKGVGKSERNPPNNNKFCTVFCISADVENEKFKKK